MNKELGFDYAFWRDVLENEVVYYLSAKCGLSSAEDLNLADELSEKLKSSLLIKTSGSSGAAKWVVHSKRSILRHAILVNKHLNVTNNDVIGLLLPAYHVGGMGVIARAHVSGAEIAAYSEKWSACACVDFLARESVSVLSLVPTQVVDIVGQGLSAPESVRVVVVGGGKLDVDVRDQALGLGWNILESYGMTETGSQIATGLAGRAGGEDAGYLPLIDGWQVRMSSGGMLEVKGECLFDGYLIGCAEELEFIDPKKDGWFATSDRVDLGEKDGITTLKFLGRGDLQVKILGELVDVSELENRLVSQLKQEVYLIPLADERRGVRLFPVVDDSRNSDFVRALNWSGLERLEEPVVVSHFPRNEMGKLQRSKLVEVVESIVFLAE